MRDQQYHSEHIARVSSMAVDASTVKTSEIQPYHVGRCVSHISLGLSVSFPDTGSRESERQLSFLLCPLSSRYLSQQWQEKKPQNQRDKLHPPTNVWTNVKVGRRGNFSIISTASMLFSVKGGVQQGQPLM